MTKDGEWLEAVNYELILPHPEDFTTLEDYFPEHYMFLEEERMDEERTEER